MYLPSMARPHVGYLLRNWGERARPPGHRLVQLVAERRPQAHMTLIRSMNSALRKVRAFSKSSTKPGHGRGAGGGGKWDV